jgi:hypothetical protein
VRKRRLGTLGHIESARRLLQERGLEQTAVDKSDTRSRQQHATSKTRGWPWFGWKGTTWQAECRGPAGNYFSVLAANTPFFNELVVPPCLLHSFGPIISLLLFGRWVGTFARQLRGTCCMLIL